MLSFLLAALPAPAPQDFTPIRLGDGEGHVHDVAILPGTDYDPALTAPDALLGQPWGSRIASHAEILAALEEWCAASDRAELRPIGRTFEGRELVAAVITSPANHARMETILRGHRWLADPRVVDAADADTLSQNLPAIAYLGYSIHGDETSGSDAAPLVAYHLLASRDPDVAALLDEVVVVLDPCMNPDGRERIRAMVGWNSGYRANLNDESLHRGRWPFGRGNHYLFDMNRDWIAGVCPETRARWALLREFPPQLFVDAHEMGGFDTFLLYPQAAPHHPDLPEKLAVWQGRFTEDVSAAFDARGWAYYTREWADAWYPGYSDAWGSLQGAIGMLYEQARFGGAPFMRASGEVVPYRAAVHHQVTASLANLASLRANRAEILRDYLAHRRANVDPARPDAARAFAWVDTHPERSARLVDALTRQGVEVLDLRGRAFEFSAATASLGDDAESLVFPEGGYVVPTLQPQGSLVRAYLAFDPRIDAETVQDERERLEGDRGSRFYDVTAWDLARQFDLAGYWGDFDGDIPDAPLASTAPRVGQVSGAGAEAVAWAVDGRDDRALAFAARALELGLAVHVADKDFSVRTGRVGEPRPLPRGSLLLRRHESGGDVGALVARAARETGVEAIAAATGRGVGEDPDLGGGHFELLERPRVALLAGDPVSSAAFGHLWHLLDAELGLPVTLLEARDLSRYDLRRYNVIVLPPGRLGDVLAGAKASLEAWVRGGGTLVACDGAAAAVADEDLELVSVRNRASVAGDPDDLAEFERAARRWFAARDVEVDLAALWGDDVDGADGEDPPADGDEDGEEGEDEERDFDDAWARRFMPDGAILRGLVDEHHWLTGGARADEIPILYGGSTVLVTKGAAPVRFSSAEELRVAGLIWPEARERLATSAWLARESVGDGQVILFASHPVFRGTTRGTARMFANAVVFGPGLGANPARGW